jgi:hypothetical protein
MRDRVGSGAIHRFGLAVLLTAIGTSVALAQGQVPYIGAPIVSPNQTAAPADDGLSVDESNTAFIDGALPRNMLRLRLDLGYHDLQPTRAEFFQAKGGVPNSRGLPLPETKVSYQELSTYAEYAVAPFFSAFVETPFRWINPDVNANIYGYGDMNFGCKLCTWSVQDFIATLQLRVYSPTAEHAGLGTGHWSIEPALLATWSPYDNIMLEGEFRYWSPLGGSDFAGDVLRYGAGISIFKRTDAVWFKPVVEAVGWSVLGGKSMVVTAPDSFTVRDAAGATIVNGYLGVRFGMGQRIDGYAGYGRCFTGSTWQRDFIRVEFRFFF